jgi:hypothetical protein
MNTEKTVMTVRVKTTTNKNNQKPRITLLETDIQKLKSLMRHNIKNKLLKNTVFRENIEII